MGFVRGTPPSMAPLIEPSPPAAVSGAGSSSSSRKKTRICKLAGALSAVALFLSLLGAAFLCYKKRHWPWRRGSNKNNTQRMESFLLQHHPRRYSYSEVKRMTKSFGHKLGQGSNGVGYRGNLPDGRDVAVKMLKEAKIAG